MTNKQQHPLESHEAELLSLLLDDLEVLEDGGHGQQNAGARADGAQEVGEHGERADAHATEQRRRGDVAVQHVDQRRVTVALHGQTVVAQLLRHVARRGARELDPQTRHERAGAQHEHHVHDELERVRERAR